MAPPESSKLPHVRDFPGKNGVFGEPATRAIGEARPSAFRPTCWSWQERFDKIPQRIGEQRRSHNRPRYFGDNIRRFCYTL
jgi:hypothetical protein